MCCKQLIHAFAPELSIGIEPALTSGAETFKWSPYRNTAKRFSPMQSIFSPAARRDTLRVRAKFDRRDGELKMDWTKPLHEARPMGIEWLAES
jgi:hypothetical protein